MSDTPELIYLIENAEQGGDNETIQTGIAARAELAALTARVAELEAGLKPFAEWARTIMAGEDDRYKYIAVLEGDLRRAADLLERK